MSSRRFVKRHGVLTDRLEHIPICDDVALNEFDGEEVALNKLEWCNVDVALNDEFA